MYYGFVILAVASNYLLQNSFYSRFVVSVVCDLNHIPKLLAGLPELINGVLFITIGPHYCFMLLCITITMKKLLNQIGSLSMNGCLVCYIYFILSFPPQLETKKRVKDQREAFLGALI